jgi:Protein of unknown function (DUF3592)
MRRGPHFMKKALSILLPAVPLILGIAFLAGLAVAHKKASRSDGWTQIIATVEKADVRPGGLDVAYRYEVGGSQHRNPSGSLTIRAAADQATLLDRYRPGRTLLAYVNPANPAESILEFPPKPASWPLIAGVVLLIIGIVLAIFSWRQRAQRQSVKRRPRRPAAPMSRLKPPPPPVKRE